MDIECLFPARESCAIEVKNIVSEGEDYISDVNWPDRRGVSFAASLYQASNLVLLRALEAADKLRGCAKVRIACLVVSEDIWHRVELALRDSWSL